MSRFPRLTPLVFLILSAPLLADDPSSDDLEAFEKKVRPLLIQHCQKCHGAAKQEAGLRLDSAAALRKGGDSGPSIEDEKPEESLLVEAIRYEGDIRMPPKGKLSDDEISILVDWVKRGAPWPAEKASSSPKGEFDLQARKAAQWAFQPVRSVDPPAVSDAAWATTPIDRFILAKLESAGLKPASKADKRVLLRRVTYDLIGLPPTSEELAAFLADESPRALETVVNRLLDSPHYGERWGRHWLDLVRFAETAGHEFDFEIANAWQYRDYVIRAFNADLPYNQFVIEHLAGDLLPKPRRHPTERFNESIIGTAFWFLGESKHSPVDVRADEAERFDNQIDVFGKAFLGQTLGCARCHDHKFDALSTKDYYALSGYLQSSRRQLACVDEPGERQRIAARLLEIRERRASIESAVPNSAPLKTRPEPSEGVLAFELFPSNGFDGWFVSGEAFGPGPVAGVAHSGSLSNRLEGVLRSRTFTIEKSHIHYHAGGTGAKINLIVDSYQYLQNPIYGGLTIPLNSPKREWHSQDVSKWVGHNAYIELIDGGDGFLTVDEIAFSDGAPPKALVSSGGANLPADASSVPSADQSAELKKLEAERAELESKIRYSHKVLAMIDGTPEDDKVHLRGNANKFGDVVPRRFLEAVSGIDQPAPASGSGRLELARRVVDPANPLLARVIVNRLWKHHFGEGLVRTPDDFGNMGQPPTHPELLDFLASEFVRSGWSLKHMHRLMLLTNAWQMSSRASDVHAEEADPLNKLLHRANLRRLEAEIIRDAMLAVSGRLDRTMYGPPVLPHLTPFMIGRGRPDKSGPLDGDGRRSLYINIRRNFLTPMFLAFDYPVPFSTMGKRSVSNVPAQALALMNNPLVLQQSEVWARRVVSANPDTPARLDAMFVAAFSRAPTNEERENAVAFLEMSQKDQATDEIRPWADLAHVLFNVKEFIFID